MTLEGKNIFLKGASSGASSGLGMALALHLVSLIFRLTVEQASIELLPA